MTTVTTSAVSGPYTAVAQDTFPVDFQSISATEIGVSLNDVELDPLTWTFTRDTDGTGEVVLAAPVSGEVLIFSKPDYTMSFEFQRFGAWYPDQINPALDHLARTVIALKRRTEEISGGDDTLLRNDLASPSSGSLLIMHRMNSSTFSRTERQWARVGGMTDHNLFNYISSDLDENIIAGTNAVDLAPSMQLAVQSGKKSVYIPSLGAYRLTTQVVVDDDNITIFSDQSARFDVRTGNSQLFKVRGDDFTLRGLQLFGDASLNAPVILIDTASGPVNRVRVEDIRGNALNGFYADNGGGNIVVDARLSKIILEAHRGFGINTTKHFAYYYVNQFGVSRVGLSGAAYNFAAIKVDGAEGFFLNGGSHDGTNASSIQSSQHGLDISNSTFVLVDNFIPDHVGGNPFKYTSCGNVIQRASSSPNANLSNIKATSCNIINVEGGTHTSFATANAGAMGVEFSGCSDVKIDVNISGVKSHGVSVVGASDHVVLGSTRVRAAGGNGFNIQASSNVKGSPTAIACGGHGFFSSGCVRVVTYAAELRANTGRGVVSSTGDVGVLHGLASLSANTAGNYQITDAGNRLRNCMLNDGSIVDVSAAGTG